MIPIFSWRLLTRCHVPNSSSWLRTSQPALRRSFSTIFGTSNAFPYLTCYSPYHSSSKCGGRKGAFHVQHHCGYTCVPIAPPYVNGITFIHLDAAGRMEHVSGLVESLVATTVRLKADGDKAPLFSKVSQTPPRAAHSGDTTASPVAECQTTRGCATRVNGISTTEWFGPGANKKSGMCVPR